jgi:hypothetical protein
VRVLRREVANGLGIPSSGRGNPGRLLRQWTLGQIDRHDANLDLIIGKWGEGTTPGDRYVVSLEFQRTDHGPVFTVTDSAHRPAASSDLVGRALLRSEVIGTPLAPIAFEMVDTIWLQDKRIAEIAAQPAAAGSPVRR